MSSVFFVMYFMAKMEVLHPTPTERGELQSYLRKRNLPASVAQRMRIVVLLDEGASYREIEDDWERSHRPFPGGSNATRRTA